MKYLKLFENETLNSNNALFPENYEKYINYNIGDVVELVGRVDGRNLNNHIGKILNIKFSDGECGEIESPYFTGMIYSWIGISIKIKFENDFDDYKSLIWYISPYNIKIESKKKKKLKKPEIDPFDEERWGWVED